MHLRFCRGALQGRGTAGGGAREAGRDGGHGVPEHTDPYLLMETGCVQIGGPSGRGFNLGQVHKQIADL